jgi:hypothetical protein
LGAVAVPTDAQRKLIFPGGSTEPPSYNCVIKANLKARGGCIYHVPGGQFYDRLKMEPPEGAVGSAPKLTALRRGDLSDEGWVRELGGRLQRRAADAAMCR